MRTCSEIKNDRHPRLGGPLAVYMSPFGGTPSAAAPPSPIPRKVEVDIEAAKREQRELTERRRGRFSTIFTRGQDLGITETSKSALLGL